MVVVSKTVFVPKKSKSKKTPFRVVQITGNKIKTIKKVKTQDEAINLATKMNRAIPISSKEGKEYKKNVIKFDKEFDKKFGRDWRMNGGSY